MKTTSIVAPWQGSSTGPTAHYRSRYRKNFGGVAGCWRNRRVWRWRQQGRANALEPGGLSTDL